MIIAINSPSEKTLHAQLHALGRVMESFRDLKREEEHQVVVPPTAGAYTLFTTGILALLEELRREGYLLAIENEATLRENATVMSMEHDGAFDHIPFIGSDILQDRKDLRGVLMYMVGELTDNIRDHARTSYGVLGGSMRSTWSVAIIDRGISIPGAYRAAGVTLRDECEALTRAIEGISTKTVEERGTGLPSVRRLMREAFKGELVIISAGALFEDQGTPRCAPAPFFWQGVVIYLTGTIPPNSVNLYDYLTH